MRASIIILAGGRSRRFGTDKAAFRIGGGTLLERTASAARETGLPVTVVGRRRPDPWPWPDVGFQPDEVPDLGPMGGLITGLRAAGTSVLAVGCDMPLLTPRALGWLAGEAGASGAEHGLVTFLEGGGLQPLFAVYTPASLPLIGHLMAGGMRSLHALVSAGRFRLTRIPNRYAGAVRGINTSEEAEELARELGGGERRRQA